MWLNDIQKAIKDLQEICPDYIFTKITPAGSGIVFYTTYFSRVFWCDGGQIIEHYENGETKILKNFS